MQLKEIQRFFQAGLNLLFPPRCVFCDELSGSSEIPGCCERCWLEMYRPVTPQTAVRCVGTYTGSLRRAILRLKFDTDPLPLRTLRHGMSLIAEDSGVSKTDLFTSIPPDPLRLRKRGFDLPGTMAKHLARTFQAEFKWDVLVRTRSVPEQRLLDRPARIRNLEGAFSVSGDLSGKRIVLIDDVVTTGATVQSASKVLRDAGASEVVVLAIAHTPEGTSDQDVQA